MQKKIVILIPLLLFLFGVYNLHEIFYKGAVNISHVPYWKSLFWITILGTVIVIHYYSYINEVLKQFRRVLFYSGCYWAVYLIYRVYVCFKGEIILSGYILSFVNFTVILIIIILMLHERTKTSKHR